MEIRTVPEERYTIGGVVYGLCYTHRPAFPRGHSYLATCPLCEAQIISTGETQAAALISDKIRIGVHYRAFHRAR